MYIISGDMVWTTSRVRRHIEMIRLWNRLIQMPETRLTHTIFPWDKSILRDNWSQNIKHIFTTLQQPDAFDNLYNFNINSAWALSHDKFSNIWHKDIQVKPKLRTYKLFKTNFGPEQYVLEVKNKRIRSCFSKLRCDILPLQLETLRWQGVPADRRCCVLCKDKVEDEAHFLFDCPNYTELRRDFINTIFTNAEYFAKLSTKEKFIMMMKKPP